MLDYVKLCQNNCTCETMADDFKSEKSANLSILFRTRTVLTTVPIENP
jgi:hypothetical protein